MTTPAQRAWLRSAARGNPYRVEAGAGPVDIGELVSPLRYDILLRARHFEWHAQHRRLFSSDFEAYQRLARAQSYFVWFERVMVPRWLPAAHADPERLELAWRDRLRASAALHESFEEGGFDSSHPIELYAGHRVRDPASGRRASRALFAGDGNHRLGLLMASGRDTLLPAQYRVKRYLSLEPIDTTGQLLSQTNAGWSEYRSFMRLGYPSADLEIAGDEVSVEAPDPSVAAEVRALAERDRRCLQGVAA